jgi:hypothetical protein
LIPVETRHGGGHIVTRVLKRLYVQAASGGKIILKNPLMCSGVADLDETDGADEAACARGRKSSGDEAMPEATPCWITSQRGYALVEAAHAFDDFSFSFAATKV